MTTKRAAHRTAATGARFFDSETTSIHAYVDELHDRNRLKDQLGLKPMQMPKATATANCGTLAHVAYRGPMARDHALCPRPYLLPMHPCRGLST